MRKIIKKKQNRILSENYLDKISGILRDRWAETQQAMQHKTREEKLSHHH
ncbi:hypothetical protein [Aphanothece hegewaldii]|nr:hypothetical protein [Aphanothece hegewaldii]